MIFSLEEIGILILFIAGIFTGYLLGMIITINQLLRAKKIKLERIEEELKPPIPPKKKIKITRAEDIAL